MNRIVRLLVLLPLLITTSAFAQENVDSYGAVGDGATDDSNAITAAIAAAGEGGTVEFTANKTYLVCKTLKPMKDQVIDFKGGTMKKCNELVAQVQSYDGNGMWRVSNISGFEVGMWLSASSNGGYDQTTGPLEVLAIQGETLTTSAPLFPPLPNTTITSDSPFFSVNASGVTIQNFSFDGNYPNNRTILKWDTSVLLLVSGNNTEIKDGSVRSIPGDFMRFASESNGSSVSNVDARDGAGVFAHLSGIGFEGDAGITIRDNTISDLGKEALRQDHARGSIEWSFDVGDVTIMNNTFRDLPIYAIFMDDDPQASQVMISNNEATNTEGFVGLQKLFVDYEPGNRQELIINNNTLRNTKRNWIYAGEFGESVKKISISNNDGENTYWEVQGVSDFEFKNNEMRVTSLGEAGIGEFDFFFSPGILQLRSLENGVIEGNTLEGNWRQISFENKGRADGYGYDDEYTINDNILKDFLYSGIQGRANSNGIGGSNEVVNWTSNNNRVTSSVAGNRSGLSPSAWGVIYSAGGTHTNNCVEINSSANDTFAARVFGLASAGSAGAGGTFTDNVYANANARAGWWGGGDQSQSLSLSNTTVSDITTIDFVAGNGGVETGTIVDAGASCSTPPKVSLNAPADNATNVFLEPTLAWQRNGTSFQVQVSTVSDFSTLILDQSGVVNNSLKVGPLDFSTQYFWRVRARNNVGQSPWSDSRAFTTESDVVLPSRVVLSSPADNAVDQDVELNLEWMTTDNSSSYRIQFAEDGGFANIIQDVVVASGTSHPITGLTVSKQYWWRVKGVNADGESALWSAGWSFTTKATNTAAGDEIPSLSEIEVYPNPATKTMNIDLGDTLFESVRLIDGLGRVVRTNERAGGVNGRIHFELGDLPPGAFYVEIRTIEGSQRIIPIAVIR